MIDLHTHILPGVDDGVTSEEEALEFARMAREDGVRTIVATPHCKDGFYSNERDRVLEDVGALRRRIESEGIDVEILPGAEVHISPGLVERVRDGRALTLADNGTTLLLELSLNQSHIELENVVFQLKLAGILPVFAHPERIRFFQENIERYESLVRMGAYGQITTGSILGLFGETAREFSEELLVKGLVHVLASDAHNLRGRKPVLTPALRATADLVGEEYARRMVTDAPRALIEGREPVLPAPASPVSGSKVSLFSRWFRRGRP